MSKCDNFVNNELVKFVKKIGKKNSYIVTYGDMEFQLEKIKKSGIYSLFKNIIVVIDSKKEVIEKICIQYKNEEVIFIDDKKEHFKNLDFKKCPNLKTILFTNNALRNDVLLDLSQHK